MASEGENSNVNNNIANRRITALIVDDCATTRVVHSAVLKSQGFETCVVESAQQAIDLFRDKKEFDVVFMDISMPGKNGIQATRELREMGVTSMIIGVEVDVPTWDAQIFIDAGMDRFYEKPIKTISACLIHQEFINMRNGH